MISAIRAVCSGRADASRPLTAMDTITPACWMGLDRDIELAVVAC